MAQHKASMRATLRSAMRHKKSADMMLDSLNALTANIAAARQKVKKNIKRVAKDYL